jgi:branched-chain amino acid transport system ATP-binding protein
MSDTALLTLDAVSVRYGAIQALDDVSLHIEPNEVVALIGANGAGKSTTIRTISGLVKPSVGTIRFDGAMIGGEASHQLVRRGISECPEGRRVLARLDVQTNLELGAYTRRDRTEIAADFDRMFTLFPRLQERRQQIAGTLSGGEQQMLAIARSLMSRPRLLLLDEPSLGLAPIIVRQIFETIDELRADGVTILLVEQNATLALEHSDRGYVLDAGTVVLEGSSKDLLGDDRVSAAYLG